MTTEEKLQHFLEFCVKDSRTRSENMLDEYTAALEKSFEEHQTEARHRAEMQLQVEHDKFEREINKQLSIEQISIKRTLGHKQDELKDMLFVELKDMLAHFMESPEYFTLLESQIQSAQDFAGDDELIIYLDNIDEDQMRRLALHSKADIKLSQYSFTGGTRAVIPSKNILIDNSFETKLKEAKHNFRFELDIRR